MARISTLFGFPSSLVSQPVIFRLVRDHGISVNILQAAITPDEGGRLFAVLEGDEPELTRALDEIRKLGVRVVAPVQPIAWDEAACVHCGACVGQCAAGALAVCGPGGEIAYDAARCIACELCLPACGYGAIASRIDLLRAGGERV